MLVALLVVTPACAALTVLQRLRAEMEAEALREELLMLKEFKKQQAATALEGARAQGTFIRTAMSVGYEMLEEQFKAAKRLRKVMEPGAEQEAASGDGKQASIALPHVSQLNLNSKRE